MVLPAMTVAALDEEPSAVIAQVSPEDQTPPPVVEPPNLIETTALLAAPITLQENNLPLDSSSIPKSQSAAALPPVIQTTVQPVAIPETTPDSIVTTFNVSSTVEYIELYNQSNQPIDMTSMVFRSSTLNGQTCDLKLKGEGWLLPDEYVTITSPTSKQKAAYVFSSDCAFTSDISRLDVYYHDSRIQRIDGITASGASWFRHAANVKAKAPLDCTHKSPPSTMKQTGNSSDYVRCQTAVSLIGGSLYIPPENDGGLKIVEILPTARSCVPSDISLDCSDYIKVKNTSASDSNVAEFRLRTGAKFSSATAATSFNWHQPALNPDRDELILPAGEYFLLRLRNDRQVINLSGSDGNVWIEDYYGVKAYGEMSYKDMDLAAASGKSWAYDENDQTWKFGIPSPEGGNTYPVEEPGKGSADTPSTLKPCRDDQYRSEETNRCRSIGAAVNVSPCKEGQYRSEETNRCRSIASAAAAVLKICADDQFRNPATNRCKKIASSDDATLADCGEGRERNPETNRCRNVLSSTVPNAAFAVEHVADAGKAFIGWWALGGVGALAIGYGAWEWRREMRVGIQKAASFFTSRK
jgi:hypothetical protein